MQLTLTIPAETLANIRAASYALGGLSVEQFIEGSLRQFLFTAPCDIIDNKRIAGSGTALMSKRGSQKPRGLPGCAGIPGQRFAPRLPSFARLGVGSAGPTITLVFAQAARKIKKMSSHIEYSPAPIDTQK
jgi:hypothetical protein